MKAYVIPFIAISSVFSFGCFGQGINSAPVSELKEKVASQVGDASKEGRVIVSYKVEEVVNTASGKRITTYEVSKLEFVGTNDLGPNNTRTVTPVYGKSKLKTVEKDGGVRSTVAADAVTVKQVSVPVAVSSNSAKSVSMNAEKSVSVSTVKVISANGEKAISINTEKPVSVNAVKSVNAKTTKSVSANVAKTAKVVDGSTKKSVSVNAAKSASVNPGKSVDVNVVNTYEKVLDKGYRSIDMLRKVADKSYFDGNLTAAVKYYAELLDMDVAVDTVCYYRYALSLKGLGQMEKADEMMKVYENKKNKK